MLPILKDQSKTISTIELREIINAARVQFGEPELRNTELVRKVEDELEGELPVAEKLQPKSGGTPMTAYTITLKQAMRVSMRESKGVRSVAADKLEERYAPQAPAIKDPALAAIMHTLVELDAVKQEQERQGDEIKLLAARIDSTPKDYYTIAGYASLRGIDVDTRRANFLGRQASKLSRNYGIHVGKAHSEVFGAVNTYHVDVLAEVFKSVR